MHRAVRIAAAATLSTIAYLHLRFAPAYDLTGAVIAQGIPLRAVAGVTVVAAVVVLQFDNLAGHTIGLLAAGVALATVTTFGWTGSWAGPAAVLAVVRRVLSPLTDW